MKSAPVSRATDSSVELRDGSVVIAAITSCTNTSNPSVMIAAGLLAKKAVERGLQRKPWVKTSLAPGSKVVTDYLDARRLMRTARANLASTWSATAARRASATAVRCPTRSPRRSTGRAGGASVLSGNRNFEGRINPDVRANYLASPPLVVAYALAGRIDIDLYNEPIGTGHDGTSGFPEGHLADAGRDQHGGRSSRCRPEMFRKQYAHVFEGDELWRSLPTPTGELFEWDAGLDVREAPAVLREHAAPACARE